MRLVMSRNVTTTVLMGLIAVGCSKPNSAGAEKEIDPLKAHSVWKGTMEQSDPQSSYPVILFVKQRSKNTFSATTWYPTLGNGLLEVTGRVDANGVVSFTEDKVIHGDIHGDNLIVVPGSKYVAKLDDTDLKGTGEWEDPETKQSFTLKFSLKLAD